MQSNALCLHLRPRTCSSACSSGSGSSSASASADLPSSVHVLVPQRGHRQRGSGWPGHWAALPGHWGSVVGQVPHALQLLLLLQREARQSLVSLPAHLCRAAQVES